MTVRFVGPGGNDANSGLTWALRKLTLNGVENTPVVSGDVVWVGPGTYRELLTLDVSGGSSYTVGTVTVTNGSPIVKGSGTSWLANSFADGQFQIQSLSKGTDGVTNGTNTFTSDTGNWTNELVGWTIRINTKTAGFIKSVESLTSMTIMRADGAALNPTAANTLTYNIGPETPYEIESVDSDTQITLKEVWNGINLSGCSYQTWKDIRYIGDVTGENTDGVGGYVRITGSTNDITMSSSGGITGIGRDFRTFRGFTFDGVTGANYITYADDDNWIIEDCTFDFIPTNNSQVWSYKTGSTSLTNLTIRRCIFGNTSQHSVYIGCTTGNNSNAALLIENCLFLGNFQNAPCMCLWVARTGGLLVRNCDFISGSYTSTIINVQSVTYTIGQCITVVNSRFVSCGIVFGGNTIGDIQENCNLLLGNRTNYNNCTAGVYTVTTTQPFFSMPILHKGSRFPYFHGEVSPWASDTGRKRTWMLAHDDLFGFRRVSISGKSGLGAIQFTNATKESIVVQAGTGSMLLTDAGEVFLGRILSDGAAFNASIYTLWDIPYSGVSPQMILRQPGKDDTVVTAAGTTGGIWTQMSTNYTPNTYPNYVEVLVRSNNITVSGVNVYFDSFDVTETV